LRPTEVWGGLIQADGRDRTKVLGHPDWGPPCARAQLTTKGACRSQAAKIRAPEQAEIDGRAQGVRQLSEPIFIDLGKIHIDFGPPLDSKTRVGDSFWGVSGFRLSDA
jgi:hypothetical protein